MNGLSELSRTPGHEINSGDVKLDDFCYVNKMFFLIYEGFLGSMCGI